MLDEIQTGRTRLLQRNLHQAIVDDLGERIVRGEWKPGEVLPNEIALGREFGVSRTVVREANHLLAVKGLVESRPKIGTRVRPRKAWSLLDPDVLAWTYRTAPDLHLLRNLSEVRQMIEPTAAELAARRATDAELARMAELLDQMDAVTGNAPAYIEADLQFHATILAATHNELLEQMTNTIRMALIMSRRITVQLEGGTEGFMPHHRAVFEAVRARDSAAARAAMTALIISTVQGMQQVLGQPFEA